MGLSCFVKSNCACPALPAPRFAIEGLKISRDRYHAIVHLISVDFQPLTKLFTQLDGSNYGRDESCHSYIQILAERDDANGHFVRPIWRRFLLFSTCSV